MGEQNVQGWIAALLTQILGWLLTPLAKWLNRPKLKLKPDMDWSTEDEYYLRLEVKNKGRNTAKQCFGRLIELRDEKGKADFRQLNLCWERHNQMNLPHPEDIPKVPFALFLDIAKHKVDDDLLKIRVDADSQQLKSGQYDFDLRELAVPVKTYFARISVTSEDGYANTKWYALDWNGSEYSIRKKRLPLFRRR